MVRNAFYTVMQIRMYNGDKGLERNAYFTIETVGSLLLLFIALSFTLQK